VPSGETFKLRFAKDAASRKDPPRYWRSDPIPYPTPKKPLLGLKIALDPGHIGGSYAQMEKRWFQVQHIAPVAEGDLTLQVAQKLSAILTKLGAEVLVVRQDSKPTTKETPQSLRPVAEKLLREGKILPSEDPTTPEISERDKISNASELLFYRVSEIRARADIINKKFKPDLTVCLHFNAENWGDPSQPKLVNRDHLHLLVNGAYTSDELSMDDVRLEMFIKLLNGSHALELQIADKVANAMAKRTGLLPCYYPGGSVKKVSQNPYLWARNLLANRLYQSPVIYLEPYVMNSPEVFARIQAGDYEGERKINGKFYPSIFREYASGVAEGLLDYYRNDRKGSWNESQKMER